MGTNYNKAIGFLVGSRVLIFDKNSAHKFFEMGFFGKPFGVRKPKSIEDLTVPLELSLIEATYLMEKGFLKVIKNNRELRLDELTKLGNNLIPGFKSIYKVYKSLREEGFIVRSGLKFGADFAIYTERPGLQHAPYLIKVYKSDELVNPIDLVGLGRLSHSVRKRLILSIITSNKEIRYVMLKWVKM